MRVTKMLVGAGLAVALAAPLTAQQMHDEHTDAQMAALQLQRHLLLAMADSMPERLYTDKVTPIQRDFAQQIMHAAGSAAMIVGMTMGSPRPTLPDTGAAHTTRAGLDAYINACYDYAEGVLRNQTEADRHTQTNLFGMAMPRWKVWDEIHQHTFWTAGQVVANFRKNGMAPPGFGFF